jgi:hypothetical protein
VGLVEFQVAIIPQFNPLTPKTRKEINSIKRSIAINACKSERNNDISS